jgi:hypothetical protein
MQKCVRNKLHNILEIQKIRQEKYNISDITKLQNYMEICMHSPPKTQQKIYNDSPNPRLPCTKKYITTKQYHTTHQVHIAEQNHK